MEIDVILFTLLVDSIIIHLFAFYSLYIKLVKLIKGGCFYDSL